MDKVLAVWAWVHSSQGASVLLALVSISEALDAIPAIKASSIWRAVFNGIVWIKDQLVPKKDA